MKTIFCLTLLCAFIAQAQYSSKWSEFDSGRATHSGGTISQVGVFNGWLRKPMTSANYVNQQGYPASPTPVQTPGLPTLTITLVSTNARVAWPAATSGNFALQESALAGVGASWVNIPGPYPENGGERFVLVPVTQPSRFYRLFAP
jgi:hypothetical protein